MVVEKQFSSQSGVTTVQKHSTRESSGTLKLVQNDVVEQMLQHFPGYEAKWKDGSYVEGNILTIVRLYAWVAIVVRFAVENGKREEHR